ncbi:hypothetical protein AgCh_037821 [Apium graveolens]
MDVAMIDWKDSKFVKDEALENINAPQWFDFTAPFQSVDDDSWFCKPDCNHPKTVDDFLKKTPPTKTSVIYTMANAECERWAFGLYLLGL